MRIKEYSTNELLMIANNVTGEYPDKKVRQAKLELYNRGVTDKGIADIMEEEKYDLKFKQRIACLLAGDIVWVVTYWFYYTFIVD